MHSNNINNKNKPKVMLMIAIFFIFGMVFLGVGTYDMGLWNNKYSKYIETQGKVVDYKEDTSSGTTLYAPVIQYTVNGQDYTICGNEYNTYPANIGTTQRVKYNPDNPQDAIWVRSNNTANLTLICVGAVFILIAIVGIILKLRYNAKQAGNNDTSSIDISQQF